MLSIAGRHQCVSNSIHVTHLALPLDFVHHLSSTDPLHAHAQKQEYASGIDTGCVLGDYLTALVLPSLNDLKARGWTLPDPPHGLTRDALGAELVAVRARKAYCK